MFTLDVKQQCNNDNNDNDKIHHGLVNLSYNSDVKSDLRPDFTSKLVHGLAFGTPKFYIAPYYKINRGVVNLSSNFNVKSDLKVPNLKMVNLQIHIRWHKMCRLIWAPSL